MKPRRIYKNDQEHDRRKRPPGSGEKIKISARLRIFLHAFLSVVFLAVLVYVLFFSPFLKVQNIVIEGNQELAHDELHQAARELYAGKYLGLLPRDNFFLFPEKRLQNKLKDRFRKISELSVTKTFPDKIVVSLKERQSLILWCSGGPCSLVDENGYAYVGADFNSPDIQQNNLVQIVDTSAKPVSFGDQVLTQEYITFVLEMMQKFPKDEGVALTEQCSTPSRLAGEISCISKEGIRVALSTEIPLSQTLKTMDIFMRKQLGKGEISKLEYLDLRFENRVYYKMKGQEENLDEQGDGESMVAGEESAKDDSQKASDEKKKK